VKGESPRESTVDTVLGGRVRIFQPRGGHRAGTDSALLAACVPLGFAGRAYDLGAGAGSVGLSVALQSPLSDVTLVEIDPKMAALAASGIEANGVGDRVRVVQADLLARGRSRHPALAAEGAELVLTNPPFHVEGTVRNAATALRRQAHNLSEADEAGWIEAAVRLLRPRGVLVVIHRADALARLLSNLDGRVGDIRLKPVHPRLGSAATRLLVRALKASRSPLTLLPPLILHEEGGAFTREADALHKGAASVDWQLAR
jgi:tRNA1(Val) A37 N6-methylase TrmN6